MLQAVPTQVDVVVEQDHVVALAGLDAEVDRPRERIVVIELDDLDVRPVFTQPLAGLVGRAVLDDDHLVGDGLRGQVLQAARREVPAVVRGDDDVDRGGHSRPC